MAFPGRMHGSKSLMPGFVWHWEALLLSSYHGSSSSPDPDEGMLHGSTLLPAAQHLAKEGEAQDGLSITKIFLPNILNSF